MTRATTPLDTALIEYLDFTPRCEVVGLIRRFRRYKPTQQCKHRAKWMATLPCCGMQVFSCHRHRSPDPRTSIEMCGGCRCKFRDVESWLWVAI